MRCLLLRPRALTVGRSLSRVFEAWGELQSAPAQVVEFVLIQLGHFVTGPHIDGLSRLEPQGGGELLVPAKVFDGVGFLHATS